MIFCALVKVIIVYILYLLIDFFAMCEEAKAQYLLEWDIPNDVIN